MVIRIAICLTSIVLLAGNASAQHVRMILPVSAGSGVDTIARAVAPALSKTIGAQVVIENLPGAGGVTGTAAIVKAPANGQTIGLVSNNHVINPSVYPKMPFDSIEDITSISVLGTTPLVLVVHPKVPAKDVAELIAFAKAKPGAYNYASAGNGTIIHLAGEMFVREAGIEVNHIPYKGTGPMLQDLVGGQVEMGVVALPAVQGHLRSGALRAIGITGRQRAPAAKDIPTVAEQGLPNYDVEGWFAVVGPAKLPAAEVNRIHGAFAAAFATPEVQEAMRKQGNVIKPTSPQEAAQIFRAELAKYAKVVKAAGVKID
ncbi:MAG TPA: tripartite tricarboxylate transporter substrate binding protein [Burkholderiales bacterium]|nr:tripartite tricarboxylate transporter substrate binding protein [Burkholderiales bacterium]